MKLEPIDIVNIIALFQLSIFVFFLFRKKSSRISNKILAAFLFIQFVIIFNVESFRLFNYIVKLTPHIFHIGSPFIFLAAPVFYLYIASLIFTDFKLRKHHIFHTIPFDIMVIIFAISFYRYPAEMKIEILKKGILLSPEFWTMYYVVLYIQILIYFIIDIIILHNYRKEIKEQYSSVKNINLTWLSFILYCFIISWLTSITEFFVMNYFIHGNDIFLFSNFFSFFLFFNFIFYKGLSQPEIFSGLETKQKYVSSKLSSRDAKIYLEKLIYYMKNEKPYLNPDLTLKELASTLSISPRYLSQVINGYKNQNFYDYISQCRIEEAKKILSDPQNNKTVLEVLYQVGFNSKSSFNTAFKKFTGVTPSHYKKGLKFITT